MFKRETKSERALRRVREVGDDVIEGARDSSRQLVEYVGDNKTTVIAVAAGLGAAAAVFLSIQWYRRRSD